MALFIIPPYSLIIPAIFLLVCFSVLGIGKTAVKLKKEEIANPSGSIMPLILICWGIDIAALLVSLFIMAAITQNSFLSVVHSEWGIAQENAYAEAAIYIVLWTIVYTALFSLSRYSFRNIILDVSKRKKLFISLLSISALLFFASMCVLFLWIFA